MVKINGSKISDTFLSKKYDKNNINLIEFYKQEKPYISARGDPIFTLNSKSDIESFCCIIKNSEVTGFNFSLNSKYFACINKNFSDIIRFCIDSTTDLVYFTLRGEKDFFKLRTTDSEIFYSFFKNK